MDGNDGLTGGAFADVIVGGAGDHTGSRTGGDDTLLAGNQVFIWDGLFTAGHLRYVGGVLQGNTDGDAAAEFEIHLVSSPALVVGEAGTDILL